MATIARRSHRMPIPAATELAAADDLNGAGTTLEVTGAERVLIVQAADGTAGTAGIDVLEISKDGGVTWTADDTLLALASDDDSGTVVANAALNAAGVEPSGCAIFKSGPHKGVTHMRVVRDATVNANSAAWVTGAPSVDAITIGK